MVHVSPRDVQEYRTPARTTTDPSHNNSSRWIHGNLPLLTNRGWIRKMESIFSAGAKKPMLIHEAPPKNSGQKLISHHVLWTPERRKGQIKKSGTFIREQSCCYDILLPRGVSRRFLKLPLGFSLILWVTSFIIQKRISPIGILKEQPLERDNESWSSNLWQHEFKKGTGNYWRLLMLLSSFNLEKLVSRSVL